MKIAVINGSPKGKYSITLQTVLYLQRKFPEHTFEVLHAGQKIKALEKDFSSAKQLMESADAVFSPTRCIPSLHRLSCTDLLRWPRKTVCACKGSTLPRFLLPSISMM